MWLCILAGKFLFPNIPPIKLEQKVALCAANKIGHPLPREMLLRDKLPTFHFRLLLLLSLRSNIKILPRTNLFDFLAKVSKGNPLLLPNC